MAQPLEAVPVAAPAVPARAIKAKRVPTLKTDVRIRVKFKRLEKSAAIFQYTHASAAALVIAFNDAKAKRGGVRGVLTDLEQDILRAALVMSCAGLDATLKRLIRDCLQELLDIDNQVRKTFEEFIQRRISAKDGQDEFVVGAKFLSVTLADKQPRARLIEEYIKELTGESLQSVEQVLKTLAALGLDFRNLKIEKKKLAEIFSIRNQIIHELDMNIDTKAFRKRRVRGQDDLLDNSDVILGTAKSIIEGLETKLQAAFDELV